ncbi:MULTISPECIES: hypothetical protein [Polymorphospora]|uniref:Lipoprotein n=1 Tax=Polymorphospora lycopeni TaxID=3140240 RepID=A0ABV5CM82_9ACTN
MHKTPRRRLRSASVQLGALTALALTLTACDSDDDDDCAMGPVGGGGAVAMALQNPVSKTAGGEQRGTAAVPERGGFGTHLASCGG